MSLSTFMKVVTGQYSDEQIREAAAAYYERTAAAAVAAVNNDITVNVNIDGETVKQFKPESPKAEQPEKQPVKQEKKPEQPKQPEKKPEQAKQPEKKPEQPKQPEPEKKPEPPVKQEKKPEQKAEQPEKQSVKQEKKPEPEKPKQQDVTAQQAAHTVNGFNIAAFTQPQPSPSATQQVARMPMPTTQPQPPAVTAIPLLPPEYNSMSPSEKCDVLFDLAVCGVLPPFANPRAGFTNQQKLNELKKNFTFLHIEGRSISTLQLDMLYGLLESPRLKSTMNRHDAIDRANNPKLTEVPVTTHATGEQTKKYDMCFEVKLRDPAKKLVVLYSTVPAFSMATGTWGQELELFVK